jgi:hypothetical protein
MLQGHQTEKLVTSASRLYVFTRTKSSIDLVDGSNKQDGTSMHLQMIRRCASAFFPRNRANDDLLVTMRESAMLFQNVNIAPACSKASDPQYTSVAETFTIASTTENDIGIRYGDSQSLGFRTTAGYSDETQTDITIDDQSISDSAESEPLPLLSLGSEESFNSWTDPKFLEDNVIIERLNENVYEKKFYEQGLRKGHYKVTAANSNQSLLKSTLYILEKTNF